MDDEKVSAIEKTLAFKVKRSWLAIVFYRNYVNRGTQSFVCAHKGKSSRSSTDGNSIAQKMSNCPKTSSLPLNVE